MISWRGYPNFSEDEFRCRCGCGEALMDVEFMESLQRLRTACGFPFIITSGYRCKDHPAEKRKAFLATTGEHVLGKAADINVFGSQLRALLLKPEMASFPRIGLKQHGPASGRFIHLGTASPGDGLPWPAVWTY